MSFYQIPASSNEAVYTSFRTTDFEDESVGVTIICQHVVVAGHNEIHVPVPTILWSHTAPNGTTPAGYDPNHPFTLSGRFCHDENDALHYYCTSQAQKAYRWGEDYTLTTSPEGWRRMCFFATEDKEGTTCDAGEGWFGEELASHFEWVAPDQKMCMLHRVKSNWATVSNVDTGDNYFSANWIFRLRGDFTQAG
jgi:hypothetical protein